MCVGLSARVVRVADGTALIDASGAQREVSAGVLPDGAGRFRHGARGRCDCKDHGGRKRRGG